ncbi:MAG: alpha-1,2-fucosyltransferase [Ferrovibrio sp.]|uniref:alpha-1,2-fucosyltransferase n=1 Tax=Ferrovibrio sp. TaxID=1917215 RepID=UPI00391AD1B1
MIVIRLLGGLGNQMFQYAFGRRLALERGVPLKLDIESFRSDKLRNYELGHLNIKAELAHKADLANMIPWPQRLHPRLARLGRYWPSRMPTVHERGFQFNPAALNCGSSAYLIGYWQSERYFSTIADTIRAEFQPVQPLSAQRIALAEQMATVNAISLHVRRGDYASNPVTLEHHGLCPIEWYVEAMGRMAERIIDPVFFVFSDDPEWTRSNLPHRWPLVFVDPQGDGRDFEDMHLMARCRHHITANSSFSWWGAWLNPRPDKLVFAPRRWFATNALDTRDLIPDTWSRL